MEIIKNPSLYQKKVFEAVKNTNQSLLIDATAGSGKTTTIVQASYYLPKFKSKLFVAFNKSVVEELKDKFENSVECSTLHSVGWGSVLKNFKQKKYSLTQYKVLKVCQELFRDLKMDFKELQKFQFQISDLINMARLNLAEPNIDSLKEIIDEYDFLFSKEEIDFAVRCYQALIEYDQKRLPFRYFDFNDMIYLPVKYDLPVPQYDVVFIDECQDLNVAQQKLVDKLTKRGGRQIFVGDPNQAIYGFAGADFNSFQAIKEREDVLSLPLSISYRCPVSVVNEAKKFVPRIEAYEKALPGFVGNKNWTEIEEGDMVVCRNNAPIFSLCIDLIEQGKKAFVRGRELEAKIAKYLNKYQYLETEKFFEKMHDELDKLEQEILKFGSTNPRKNKSYIAFEEMIEIMRIVAKDSQYVIQIMEKFEEVFAEEKGAVELMSIHKAKGLERENVWFLNPELIPSKWAESEKDLLQESNLRFVAITRAKKNLYYCSGYIIRSQRD